MNRILVVASLCFAFGAGCGGSPPTGDGGVTPDLASRDSAAGSADQTAPADTWSNYAQGFFATYCVSCHGPGNQTRDYSQLAQVQRDHAKVICGVDTMTAPGCDGTIAPSQFPIGGGPFPSDGERARIVAWIEAGTP